MSVFTSAALLLGIVFQGSTPAQKPSIWDGLKQFEGHWTGPFKMQTTNLDVDLTWRRFGGHWAEVSYTYTAPSMKLEYRVLMTPNEKGDGFTVWSFGNDAKVPDQMIGRMDGKALKVDRVAKDPFTIQFQVNEKNELLMKVMTQGENPKDLGGAVLTQVVRS